MVVDLIDRAFATGAVREVTCDASYDRYLLDGSGGSVEVYVRPDGRFARANGVDGPLTHRPGRPNLRTRRGTTRSSVTEMT